MKELNQGLKSCQVTEEAPVGIHIKEHLTLSFTMRDFSVIKTRGMEELS